MYLLFNIQNQSQKNLLNFHIKQLKFEIAQLLNIPITRVFLPNRCLISAIFKHLMKLGSY